MNNNEIQLKIPSKCPKCGSDLEERTGKYGKFLGCIKFPECRYTFDLSGDTTNIKCPDCEKSLKFRSSRYGRFLNCSGYPECKFAYNPNFSEHPEIFCPKCGKTLEMKTDEHYRGVINAWNDTKRIKPIIPMFLFSENFEDLRTVAYSEKAPIYFTPKDAAFAIKTLVNRMKILK